ncbi:MAG: hypothetical protein ACREDV_03210 [Methylocella sp.]
MPQQLAGGLATRLVAAPVVNGSRILMRRDTALEAGEFDPAYKDFDACGAEDLDYIGAPIRTKM